MDSREHGPTFKPEDIVWIDFETKSRTHVLKTVGATKYATEAEAIVLAFAEGHGPINVIPDFEGLTWSRMPAPLKAAHRRVIDGKAIYAAWNAGFDRDVWNYATTGFPDMLPNRIIDVMVQATASGLAPDLKLAAKQSKSKHKDEDGRRLIKKFCLPSSTATPESDPEDWALFLAYAGNDIEAMRSVFLGTRQLPLAEWQEYWAMEIINVRGVCIDEKLVDRAAILVSEDRLRSEREIFTITRGAVRKVTDLPNMRQWLNDQLPPAGREMLVKREAEVDDETGEETKPAKLSLTRKQVSKLIAYCQHAQTDFSIGYSAPQLHALQLAERVLQIRLYGGSATPAKFFKMQQQNLEGVLYGQYVFNGAPQTGRASSRGVQIHNLARDTLPYEHDAIEAILAGCDYDALAKLGDDTPVSRKLSLLIRPTFVPIHDDNVFVWSDWSQIEARILPWLVGDNYEAMNRLDLFKAVDEDPTLADLYTRTAAAMSHVDVSEVTKAMRQRGKVAELALGFGGGVGALQNMAASYGLFLTDEEARQTVDRWREVNGWCVKFWGDVWNAILAALQAPMSPVSVGRLAYVYMPNYLDGSLICVLPSGRLLTYRSIRYDNVAIEDDDGNVVGHEVQLRFARGYGRVKLWHGLAVENAVQATAADVLRGTLPRLLAEGHDVRVHTHDEILTEAVTYKAERAAVEMRAIMLRGFEWSEGLPLMSEETISPYYTKVEL